MPNTKLSSLSIFFPVYNEEANIGLVIEDALKYAKKAARKFEIIVVNDGSTDRTSEVIKTYVSRYENVRLVTHETNRGYGSAVKTGLKSCRYEWVFFTDSDGQFHFDGLEDFVAQRTGVDMVLGYRTKRRDHLLRVILAQGMLRLWNYLFFGLKLKDVDCAYKLIPTSCLKNIKLTTSSAITVTELMYRLINQGYRYHQVPVTHYPRLYGSQTGGNIKVIVRALKESIILWWELRCEKNS